MTPRTVRKAERLAHLAWGSFLLLYVYGLLPTWGEPVVRWIVVPGLVGSGLAMWFAAPLRRFVRHLGEWRRIGVPREEQLGNRVG